MAVSLPTSADVRKVRTEATKAVNSQFEIVKTPLLAWVGAGDYAYAKVNEAVSDARTRAAERREVAAKRREKLQSTLAELPTELREQLNPDALRKRVDEVTEQAKETYTELAERGEKTVEKIRKQPQVKKVLETVADATDQLEVRLEKAVDDAHDVGEEVLGRVSVETRSVGEKAARATQRIAGEAAESVSEAADELSESVTEAGDEAAHTTRSVTRKAANRTAPKKPAATRRGTNGTAT